jgi:3-polyprenyl-4-hydroxybenzoate decarboxylase
MSIIDLRDFIEKVEQHGELLKIKGSHWDLEMGGYR